MDVVNEQVIPAYLESNQLIFEYENVGVYNSVIFPVMNSNYDFKPEITVPYDIVEEKKLQNKVDEGQSPWRLNPIITAHIFVNDNIIPGNYYVDDYPIDFENLSLLYCDNTSAILKINDTHTNIQTVYLKRLIKQDSTGIWTIIGYDEKKHNNTPDEQS